MKLRRSGADTLRPGEHYFLRYIMEPENAKHDLKRGYSLTFQWFDSPEEAKDWEFKEEYGFTDEDIMPITINGHTSYSFSLGGLAAAKYDDDIEYLEEEARETGGYASYSFPYAAIYTGRYVSPTDDPDQGVVFTPRSLVEVIPTEIDRR